MTAIGATYRIRREGALRSRAARGDSAAFAAVYERHHQALYRYCRSILRNDHDAQDALQSTMTRAFAALQDEQRDFELRPWLFRIAHNEAISILRRRRETGELDDQPASGEIEDRVSEREELRVLRLDLAELPDRQRAALVLRELNGLAHAEIGVVLELSPAAVKQAIFEARSTLFTFREGREMACQDIRRMLSDGDGRVLRGRGMRAHLRACPDCRRFREDLEHRPAALRALAPPLPVGAGGALLAQLLGGGTAAKLLACVALVGSGGAATLAVEMRDARGGPDAAAAEPAPRAPGKRAVAVPAATSAAQPVARAAGAGGLATAPRPATAVVRARTEAAAKTEAEAKPEATRRAKGPRRVRTRTADPAPRSTPAPTGTGTADADRSAPQEKAQAKDQEDKQAAGRDHAEGRGRAPEDKGKPAEKIKAPKVEKPAKSDPPAGKPSATPTPEPPKAEPPGQAKQETAPPPGQVKPEGAPATGRGEPQKAGKEGKDSE